MKNIFKKLLAMGIALMMVSACVYLPAFAASGDNEENNENIVVGDILDEIGNENSDNNEVTEKKITIAFKIGDSILKINDQDVAVTTPYEQNGTTLVPLRVITEAFGATVEWNDADMGVTLTYEDVVINIWIDRTDALVNGQKTTLLLAPQLTNDTTMVPLRFITENFGADVSYDDATEAILVEKTIVEEGAVSDYSSILHNTDKEYIGDSYYGWSMKASKSLSVADRAFDGRNTGFAYGDKAAIGIFITRLNGITKDEVFTLFKETAGNKTITKQSESKDSQGNDCLIIETKSSTIKEYQKHIISDGLLYTVLVEVSLDGGDMDSISLAETFSINVKDFKNAVDLSDVVNGKRTYENKNLKFKLDMPADWYESSNKDIENVITFTNRESYSDNSYSYVGVSIQSVDNISSIDSWARHDYEGNKELYNLDYAEFSDSVKTKSFLGNDAKYYTYSVKNSDGKVVETMEDIFFVQGDYAYNFAFKVVGNGDADMDAIKNSVTVKDIDKSKVGSLLVKQEDDITYTTVNGSANVEYSAPMTWNINRDAGSNSSMVNNGVDTSVIVFAIDGNYRIEDALNSMLKDYSKKSKNYKLIKPASYTAVGSKKGYRAVFSYEDNQGLAYIMDIFICNDGNNCVQCILDTPIEYYGAKNIKIFETVIDSVNVK